MPEQQLAQIIAEVCKMEVEQRGRKFEMTKDLRSQISTISGVLTGRIDKCGIFLCGKCGTGKTTIVRALARIVPELAQRGLCSIRAGLIGFKSIDINRDPEKFAQACTLPIVYIDDLGCESLVVSDYGNKTAPIRDVIEARYDKQLFTIFTTNATPDQVLEKYGDRVADRFREMVEKVVFAGESFRK